MECARLEGEVKAAHDKLDLFRRRDEGGVGLLRDGGESLKHVSIGACVRVVWDAPAWQGLLAILAYLLVSFLLNRV